MSREREVRNTYNQNGIDVILVYFEDTYIGIQRRGGPRDVPMFPIRIWNMYDRTQDDLPQTNNHIEGWHKGFSGNCDGTHPTVWKLIRAFQRAEVAARTDLHQVLGGHPVVTKKKYADCAAKVKNVVDKYPAPDEQTCWDISEASRGIFLFKLYLYIIFHICLAFRYFTLVWHMIQGGLVGGYCYGGGGGGGAKVQGAIVLGVIAMGAKVSPGGNCLRGQLSGYGMWWRG